ncbi:MAG: helix-turn-helix domain-containing protein [Candidatus Acidiferrales bacterium]|jgi:cytoskeleton protein RodZ
MSTTPFGERLKRERELRGVSLEEIEAATRIKIKYLEALESENWAELPGGIFNRGFIRTVARYLGMDEDSILAEYTIARKDSAADAPRFVSLEKQPRLWPRSVEKGATLAICLAAICAICWLGYRGVSGAWRAAASYRAERATVPASPLPGAVSHATGPSAAVPPAALPPSSTSPPAAPAPIEAGMAPIPSRILEKNESARVVPSVAAAADTKTYFQMKVEAGKSARIRVLADRHLVYTGHITAGETRRYRARNTFEIFSSDSGAVLIELEGQTMPPLGPSGQPGGATFTRRDMEAAAGGTH